MSRQDLATPQRRVGLRFCHESLSSCGKVPGFPGRVHAYTGGGAGQQGGSPPAPPSLDRRRAKPGGYRRPATGETDACCFMNAHAGQFRFRLGDQPPHLAAWRPARAPRRWRPHRNLAGAGRRRAGHTALRHGARGPEPAGRVGVGHPRRFCSPGSPSHLDRAGRRSTPKPNRCACSSALPGGGPARFHQTRPDRRTPSCGSCCKWPRAWPTCTASAPPWSTAPFALSWSVWTPAIRRAAASPGWDWVSCCRCRAGRRCDTPPPEQMDAAPDPRDDVYAWAFSGTSCSRALPMSGGPGGALRKKLADQGVPAMQLDLLECCFEDRRRPARSDVQRS